MNIFADHTGVIIDPFGIGLSNKANVVGNMSGIRISPRQSPVYQPMVRRSSQCFYYSILFV